MEGTTAATTRKALAPPGFLPTVGPGAEVLFVVGRGMEGAEELLARKALVHTTWDPSMVLPEREVNRLRSEPEGWQREPRGTPHIQVSGSR